MPRDGNFLLTEAVKETASQNRLTEAIIVTVTASINTPIFRDSFVIKKSSQLIDRAE